MKAVLYYFLIAAITMYCGSGCIGGPKSKVDNNAAIEATPRLTPALEKALDEYLQWYFVDLKLTNDSLDVLNIMFYRSDDGKDYINIWFWLYQKRDFEGYTYFKDHIVAYYGDDGIKNQFIDDSKSAQCSDSIPGIRAFENMDVELIGHYDPYGMKFRIINPDSLQLTYKGML